MEKKGDSHSINRRYLLNQMIENVYRDFLLFNIKIVLTTVLQNQKQQVATLKQELFKDAIKHIILNVLKTFYCQIVYSTVIEDYVCTQFIICQKTTGAFTLTHERMDAWT